MLIVFVAVEPFANTIALLGDAKFPFVVNS
jgi:hypothetical protein